MKVKFPRQSSFVPILTEWVRTNATAINSGRKITVSIGMRTGFVGQSAIIAIGDDSDWFETDWKWTANTFPARIKSLALALHAENFRGNFHAEHQNGTIGVRQVGQGVAGHHSQSRLTQQII